MSTPFVTVHLGAGKHSVANEKALKKLARVCCREGISLLKDRKSSYEAAIEVCKILENSALTNAGYGSQLNFDGVAECDASIMESSKGLGASVGCVTGITNPVEIAGHLLKDLLDEKPDIIGRVRPVMLVGRGAELYAEKKGLRTGQDLISNSALSYFLNWRQAYKELTSAREADAPKNEDLVQDTVGVICGDMNGVISVASSSGGATLKTPGRVGPAGMLRIGLNICTFENSVRAICLSGTGEDIILSQIGLNLCDTLFSGVDMPEFIAQINEQHTFQRSPLYFGALGVCADADGLIDVVYLHTTEAFVVAHQVGDKPAAVEISRNSTVGTVTLGGFAHRTRCC